MIKLNKNTLKAKNWINSEIQGYNLGEVYGRYSTHKVRAFEDCKDLCKAKNGKNLCIIGYNCNYFTMRFEVENGVYIITYANIYFIEL